ncbi:guanylate-binding protein 2-like [Mantella aurantiaca]
MAPVPRKAKSVCLIKNCAGNTLAINEEAQTILSEVSQSLVVVSIVGPYRSGKSYLVNKLSGQPGGVFSVNPTIKANTKGIWMCCMPHPTKRDHTLVLLDTEGLGDPVKGDSGNDCMILSLAMLMSSAVIYNSMGVINQDTLEKLEYPFLQYAHSSTLNLHCDILHKASAQKGKTPPQEDTNNTAPLFVWVIRDFTLKLDLDGRPVTADQYLENSLKDVAAKTPRGRKQNEMRNTIKTHFPKRKCFLFGFPSTDKKVLERMSKDLETEVAPEFARKAEEFCQFILREAPVKKLREDQIMTGSAFAQLLKSYLDVVTKCDMAYLERSMSNLTLEENQRSICKSTESYEKKMKAQQFSTEEEFQRLHKQSLEEALREFKKSYVPHETSRDEYLRQLEKDILEKRRAIWKVCEDSSLKKCEELCKQLKSRVDQKLKEHKYHVHGGYQEFVKDKDDIIRSFNEQCDKDIKAQEVLKKLSVYLEDIGNTIPKTDQASSGKASRPLSEILEKNDQ